jgi:hypothetical protein
MVELRRCDLARTYRGPRPDRRAGFALRLYPGKFVNPDYESWKPLPEGFGHLLEAWFVLVDKIYAFENNGATFPDGISTEVAHLDRAQRQNSGAVVPRAMGDPRPFIPQTLSYYFGGMSPSKFMVKNGDTVLTWGHRAMIPREGPLNTEFVAEQHARLLLVAQEAGLTPPTETFLAEALRDYVGYTPHEYRHLAFQIAERVAREWNKQLTELGERTIDPVAYSHALADHGADKSHEANGTMQALARIYLDLNGPQAFELLAGRAIEGIWAFITTSVGARKRPNLAAYMETLALLKANERDLDTLARNAHGFKQRAECRLPSRASVTAELDEVASVDQQLNVVLARLDFIIAQNQELREIALAGHDQTFEAVRLSALRETLTTRLSELRLNRETWLPVPDDEELEPLDWASIERGELGRALTPELAPAHHVRDWITPHEFAWVLDIQNRSTISRWVHGQHLPSRSDRRPWQPDAIPLDVSLGVQRRRLWVPGINADIWTELMRQALDELLSSWPKERGWCKPGTNDPRSICHAPLILPDPFADAYAPSGQPSPSGGTNVMPEGAATITI